MISWKTRNAELTREFCNSLLSQLKEKRLDPLLRRLQGKEAARISFDEIIGGYNQIKEDYHNSAIGAKDVIAAVFYEFHLVRLNVENWSIFSNYVIDRLSAKLDQFVKVKTETDIRQSLTSKKPCLVAY